jgi:hypothetical protein
MQHREFSLRGYGVGEDGRGRAHVAEVILCDMNGSVEPLPCHGGCED